MPAYFSLVAECNKRNIYDTILKDFYDKLSMQGMKFLSGYWDYMDMPYEKIIAFNQEKLEKCFRMSSEDDLSSDYLQLLYEYKDLSEVRSFIMNNPEDGIFTIHIIIPEDELLTIEKGKISYDDNKINNLIRVAKGLWELPFVDIIQTFLELSDFPNNLESIKDGAPISAEPFAIVPDNFCEKVHKNAEAFEISGGFLIIAN
ncbi:hypothetical protein [Butyrivibrio sp. WCE2006]|uniref:hypothetical protein n=1 Tax=Butyrivibrio sp. WCE2006 TaxID=1410611 RepID=UPI0006797D3D|nr:hypothetical protein [Butyrivibrio sp. WCE2006]